MKPPVRVMITGAAGQIAYSLIFRIAAGEMLGRDQPVILQLLELPVAMKALEGVVMEIEDCAFPLVQGIEMSDDAAVASRGAHFALLVGAKPRGPGMERRDLLEANGAIFRVQGKALNDNADRAVRVVVVGNPANTNAWTAMKNAPDLDPRSFTALTRLDHNRAKAMIAKKIQVPVDAVRKIMIWGNHSTTQYPDIHHGSALGKPLTSSVDAGWMENEFIPRVAKRGAEIIAARGASSAASAANAAIEHMRDWVTGIPEDEWTSMAIVSDGSYGVTPGLVYSYPVNLRNGDYHIVQGLPINPFSAEKMKATEKELLEEQEAIQKLLA